MLTREVNETLTQTGPGTPAGELLREYWHPVNTSESIPEPGDIRTVELLGERLVMYRDLQGSVNITPEQCPHRGASLAYGFVEDEGLRCSYHGWLFDESGQCLERPFETSEPGTGCHLPPYSAREEAGLIFASLRREGPPPFPLWDILARKDGGFRIDLQEPLECNWLQIQENTVDTTHTSFLHSRKFEEKGLEDTSGFSPPLLEFGFQPFEYGIVKSWAYRDEDGSRLEGFGNPLIFPNMMRIETEMHYRVPVNDTETQVIILAFDPEGEGVTTRQLPDRRNPDGSYTMTDFYSQDAMAWETQGPIADRSKEVLGASDVGIVMYRNMLRRAIEAVERGDEPPARKGPPVINLRPWMNGYLPMSAPPDTTPTERYSRDEVFDDRHRSHLVPQRTR